MMNKMFAVMLVVGAAVIYSCSSSQQESMFRVADAVEINEGFYAGCRGLLVHKDGDKYGFMGDCVRGQDVIGPVQGIIKEGEFDFLRMSE